MPRTDSGVTVASRVLGILGSFDAGHRALTLSEIARRAGLTLPTAHRLSGHASVAVVSRVGARLPLHSTGVGKVLLEAAAGPCFRSSAEPAASPCFRSTEA
jgi:DNA-binding IclR family transcriptional regulator